MTSKIASLPPHTILLQLKSQTFSSSAHWTSQKNCTSGSPHFRDAKKTKNRSSDVVVRVGFVTPWPTSRPSIILSSAEHRYELAQLPDHGSLLSQQASALTIPLLSTTKNFAPCNYKVYSGSFQSLSISVTITSVIGSCLSFSIRLNGFKPCQRKSRVLTHLVVFCI